jgi:hypothetical protein
MPSPLTAGQVEQIKRPDGTAQCGWLGCHLDQALGGLGPSKEFSAPGFAYEHADASQNDVALAIQADAVISIGEAGLYTFQVGVPNGAEALADLFVNERPVFHTRDGSQPIYLEIGQYPIELGGDGGQRRGPTGRRGGIDHN